MKSFLIVDGYNIINSWSQLKDMSKDNMEEARQRLIDVLASYQAYKGVKVILVFDAHLVKGSTQSEEIINGIKVVFTKEHQTADSYIEKIVHHLSRLHLVQVATSDWAEQQTVLSGGGIRISARELEEEIKYSQRKMNQKYMEEEPKHPDLAHNLEPHILKKLEEWRRRRG